MINGWINQYNQWAEDLSTRMRLLIIFMAGAVMTLALPPFYAFPLLFAGLSLFLQLHDRVTTNKSAFLLGWFFGFGYFLTGLYWISYALFVDIASFWWVLPFAVAGLPFLMAFYWGLGSWFLYRLNVRGIVKLFCFAGIFAVMEWLRGHMFTGYPWNLPGYTWVNFAPVFQIASLVGMYGLTLYTFVYGGLAYVFLRRVEARDIGHAMTTMLLGFALISGVWGWDRLRTSVDTTDTRIRIVQPNIKQTEKWDPTLMADHFQTLLDLSTDPVNANTGEFPDPVDAVIWPETATAFFDTVSLRRFEAEAPSIIPENGYLITGVLDVSTDDGTNSRSVRNQLVAYNYNTDAVATYSKHHLVPFGEFVPFEDYLPWRAPASNGESFTPGEDITNIRLDGLPPFSPLICYEVIFPGDVVKPTLLRDDKAQWLINITNDGWYGYTTGPFQHLAISRARAVEEGLPLVRAANTGISALIDPYGRVVRHMDLQTRGAIDVVLMKPVDDAPLYAQWGDWPFYLLTFTAFGFGIMLKRLRDN